MAEFATALYRFAPGETIPADVVVRLGAYLYAEGTNASTADRMRAAGERVLSRMLDGPTVVASRVVPYKTPGMFSATVIVEGAGVEGYTAGELRQAAIHALSRELVFLPWGWQSVADTPEEEAEGGLTVEDAGRRVVTHRAIDDRAEHVPDYVGAVTGGVADSGREIVEGAGAIVTKTTGTLLSSLWPVFLLVAALLVVFLLVVRSGGLRAIL